MDKSDQHNVHSTPSDSVKLAKVQKLYTDMINTHPMPMFYAYSILSQYPDLYAAISGIMSGKLPDPCIVKQKESDYISKVCSIYPQLKPGLSALLEILSEK